VAYLSKHRYFVNLVIVSSLSIDTLNVVIVLSLISVVYILVVL
jgi:hypothetical protein